MKPFEEIRLDVGYDFGASGGPSFNTIVVEVVSGHKTKNIGWGGEEKGFWQLGERNMIKSKAQYLSTFFRARRGMAVGFRYKDWADFNVDESITLSAGQAEVEVIKNYTSGTETYTRRLKKPVSVGFEMTLNGSTCVDCSLDDTSGIITLPSGILSGDLLHYSGTFDVPVAFATDDFRAEFVAMDDTEAAFYVMSLPIEEIRTL